MLVSRLAATRNFAAVLSILNPIQATGLSFGHLGSVPCLPLRPALSCHGVVPRLFNHRCVPQTFFLAGPQRSIIVLSIASPYKKQASLPSSCSLPPPGQRFWGASWVCLCIFCHALPFYSTLDNPRCNSKACSLVALPQRGISRPCFRFRTQFRPRGCPSAISVAYLAFH